MHTSLAGFTHWDKSPSGSVPLAGPQPKLFFTPTHIIERLKRWGTNGYRERFATAWSGFLGFVAPWLAIERTGGRNGLERVYREVLEGRMPPDRAHILSVAPL